MPIIWARSRNCSEAGRPAIISYSVNITCPPSNAGMGSRFMKAKISEKNAVLRQKIYQSHPASKMLPKVTRLPICDAPLLVNKKRIERT